MGRYWVAASALSLGLVLCSAPSAIGQMSKPTLQQPSAQQPAPSEQQPNAGQSAPAAQPPVNKEEEDAYKAFFGLTNEQNSEVISQGENFLSKYPTSRYRASVYSRLVNVYLNTNQTMKMVAVGEKAVAENPDNVDVLALLCMVIPRTVDPNSLDADQKLSEAEKMARHAIEITKSTTKPEGMTDEQFARAKNEKLGMAHFGLGLVNYMRRNAAGSAEELELATKLDPAPDPLEFFLLGTEDMQLKKFPDAMAAFDRCAKAQWDLQWQGRCKKGEEDAKQAAAAPAKP